MPTPEITSYHPTILVIFGVTGDLAQRKLLPALMHLYDKKALPKKFAIIGFSRRDWDDKMFRAEVRKVLKKYARSPKQLKKFLQLFHFQPGLFHEKQSYEKLYEHVERIDDRWGVCTNTLFHLAVPPEYYSLIFKNLAKAKLTEKCGPHEGWSRILIEKPFGNDLMTAQKLDSMLGEIFREKQIFRVDHYLGKETVRNILTFRFSNAMFEPIWNKQYIEKVEIKLLEKHEVGSRGEYYDANGALRDVGQNHLLQLLSLIAMENPGELQSDLIRRRRAMVVRALKPLTGAILKESVIRGQYIGYTKTPEVAKNSKTETYFKIKAFINNSRWRGVPFYLESGKGLGKQKIEVVVHFKNASPCFCPPGTVDHNHANTLAFMIQPTEGIQVRFWSKKPGLGDEIEPRNLSFHYHENKVQLSGYEKLLYDGIVGDQTLFSSTDEVLSAWRFITPIIKGWGRTPLKKYKIGDRAPDGAFDL